MYVAGYRGRRFASKKALKEAVAAGREVEFLDTSAFSSTHYDTTSLPAGVVLTLVGPHELDRKWYANVERRKGVVRVS